MNKIVLSLKDAADIYNKQKTINDLVRNINEFISKMLHQQCNVINYRFRDGYPEYVITHVMKMYEDEGYDVQRCSSNHIKISIGNMFNS